MEIEQLLKEASEHWKKREDEASIACYRKILELEPDHITALNMLGFFLYFRNCFEEGERICRRAVEAHPENAYARKGLGLHLHKLGRSGEGVESLKKAIELDENFVDAYHDLAYVFYDGGDYENSEFWLERGYEKVKDERYRSLFDAFFGKLREKQAAAPPGGRGEGKKQ